MASRRKQTTNEVKLPSVRNYRTWSPGLIRSAELAADQGNLRLAVDLCDWILADDKVQGALDGRINALFGLPLQFEAGRGRRRKAAVNAIEAEDDWWASFILAELKQMFAWAVVLGFGPGRLAWTTLEGHGGRVLPVTKFYHPQPIRFDAAKGWLLRLDTGMDEAIEWGNADWIGHFPFGTFRPWALGKWRGVARWCLLKAYAIGDWGRAGEKASRDVVEPATDVDKADSTKEKRQALANDIYEAARDGVIVLPRGFTYKAVETVAGTKDIFESQITMADMAIAIAIRGSNLTSGVKPGAGATFGAAQQHGVTDTIYLESDAEAWSETTHDQALTWWAEYNFGDRNLAPWPGWETDEGEDVKAAVENLKTLGDAVQQLSDAGLPIDTAALCERFDVPLIAGQPVRRGKIYQYHLTFQVVSKNELRDRLGLPPTADGDKPPTPIQAPSGDGGAQARTEWDIGDGQRFSPANERHVRLASGAAASDAPGFVEGQLYADALTESGSEIAGEIVQPTLDAVLEELRAAKDYDDLRRRLRARYADLSADDFAELVYRHMVVAELAGRHAVNRDAGA